MSEVDIPLEPVEEPRSGDLIPTLSPYSVTPDKRQIIFTDTSIYGRPNHKRSELALVLTATYKAVAGDEPMAFAPYANLLDDEAEPQQFILDWPKDGWVQVSAYWFDAPLDLTAVAEGKVIYSREHFRLMKKTGGVLTPIEIEAADIDALFSKTVDEFPVIHNAYYKQTMGEEATNLIPHTLEDESCFEIERAIRKYNTHNIGLATAVWQFCKGERYLAQKNVEVLNQIISC